MNGLVCVQWGACALYLHMSLVLVDLVLAPDEEALRVPLRAFVGCCGSLAAQIIVTTRRHHTLDALKSLHAAAMTLEQHHDPQQPLQQSLPRRQASSTWGRGYCTGKRNL